MTAIAVPAPMFISSRLMAAVTLDDAGTVHIEITGRNGEGRVTTRCVIEDGDGRELYDGTGTSSGCNADPDFRELMEATLSFIEHDGDRYRATTMGQRVVGDGEHPLFNDDVAEWAYMNDDAIAIARCLLDHD